MLWDIFQYKVQISHSESKSKDFSSFFKFYLKCSKHRERRKILTEQLNELPPTELMYNREQVITRSILELWGAFCVSTQTLVHHIFQIKLLSLILKIELYLLWLEIHWIVKLYFLYVCLTSFTQDFQTL